MRGLIILAFIVGVVLLQIFLSKTESRWPGLVLPIIAFLFSFFLPLNMMIPADGVTASFYVQMAMLWLFGNIPTIILLAIYFVCREKYRRKKQLDKMNIQDLN
ncbi:MAG TPA: hypothetical protein PK604_14645 [Acetivibrio clariflavus]|nr:hypothetical protein [Acetivibrio clariflavus]HPU42196.1 hypothetical protein [Acetivibrio clariflavus]